MPRIWSSSQELVLKRSARRCAAGAGATALLARHALAGAALAAGRSQTVPGMPPVADPANLYSETGAGKLSAGGAAARCRASTCRTCSRTTST